MTWHTFLREATAAIGVALQLVILSFMMWGAGQAWPYVIGGAVCGAGALYIAVPWRERMRQDDSANAGEKGLQR